MPEDYMTWTRGSNDVWDNWANITEDEGWAWKNIEPYYLKVLVYDPPLLLALISALLDESPYTSDG